MFILFNLLKNKKMTDFEESQRVKKTKFYSYELLSGHAVISFITQLLQILNLYIFNEEIVL